VGFELTMLVVIGTDCINNYKSNYLYHTIKITTAPLLLMIKWLKRVEGREISEITSFYILALR
jgi:hypothetical protein